MIRPRRAGSSSRRLAVPAAVFFTCVALALAGTVATQRLHRETEERLLRLRTSEAGAVLTAAINGVEVPLAVAAQLGSAANGADAFVGAMQQPLDRKQFAAAVLYDAATARPLAATGAPVVLQATDRIAAAIKEAQARKGLTVVDLHDLPGRRLGYAYASPPGGKGTVVYAESGLPAQRVIPRGQGAFGDLDYALYLGTGVADSALLYADVPTLPITGDTARITVPFGSTALLLVTARSTSMAGVTSRQLPWLVGVGGVLFAVLAAFVTDRLLRGRARAEQLATVTTDLYRLQQQRSETLQRSLLPEAIPPVDGIEVAARYWPATTDVAVGGDFYDVFPIEAGVTGLLIGDVCGKGLTAAAITAVARHTVRAAARHGHDPADVLRWAHDAIEAHEHGQTFCTICFATLTALGEGRFRLDLALGGHPQPLVGRASGVVEALGVPGTVLGIVEPRLVTSTTVLEPGDALLLYTDGITDAPGGQGVSTSRLRDVVAGARHAGPEALADAVSRSVDAVRPQGSDDDMAVLVVRVVLVPEPAVAAGSGVPAGGHTAGGGLVAIPVPAPPGG